MKLVRIIKEYISTSINGTVKPTPNDINDKPKYLIALPNERADILIKSSYALECSEKDLFGLKESCSVDVGNDNESKDENTKDMVDKNNEKASSQLKKKINND